jgi:hypothetical protein
VTRAIVICTLAETTTTADAGALVAQLAKLRAEVPGIEQSNAGVHLPGVVGPSGIGIGALTWDITLRHDVDDALDALLYSDPVRAVLADRATVASAVTLQPIESNRIPIDAPLVKRTLLLRVRDGALPDQIRCFESDLAEMPEHITAIRSWSLARTRGDDRWTHAWEQEFASLEGLTGDYMLHPFHWSTVDAWFDPEMPDHIVEPEFAHLFYASNSPVL